MKTMALIGLILVAAASTAFAADAVMTIQTNTTIKMDPVTGQIKGDAQTQVKGIKKHYEPPEAVTASAASTSTDNTGAATAPAATSAAADPSTAATATTPASTVSSTDPSAATATAATTPASTPCATCPAAQVSNGQQN